MVLTYYFHIIRKNGNVISAKKSKVALTFSYLIFIICRTYIYQRYTYIVIYVVHPKEER